MEELPRYKCHKEAWALKIESIVGNDVGGALITPVEDGHPQFFVPPEYMAKHKPEVGGYWVEYEDGYQSYSPAEAFENGYTRID